MAVGDYKRALRQGRKEYQANLAKGVYPYLQVLEELRAISRSNPRYRWGSMIFRLTALFGTNSHARSTAFASNFMPFWMKTANSQPSGLRFATFT